MNFPEVPLHLADIATLDQAALRGLLPQGVDGIVGGPPCQAFSEIGLGRRDDTRKNLVGEFFRIVSLMKPAFFVMENVRGLGFPRNRSILDAGLGRLKGRWTIIGPTILDAADYGAPTRRRRLFVIGFDPERVDALVEADLLPTSTRTVTVRDAIADLTDAAIIGEDVHGEPLWSYGRTLPKSSYARAMRSRSGVFNGHRRTVHEKATVRRFAKVPPGSADLIGKHMRLSWEGLAPALRAGTGNDHGSYQAVRPIHPCEDRVITVREAARLQGFHDDFEFHPTIWHSFRMIGNSVSPIIARAILTMVSNKASATASKTA